jgi:hypothetical protein
MYKNCALEPVFLFPVKTLAGNSNSRFAFCRPDVGYGLSPARGPPLWDDFGCTQMGDGVPIEPDWVTDWDEAAQPTPDYEGDQRVNWCQRITAIELRCWVGGVRGRFTFGYSPEISPFSCRDGSNGTG